MGYMLAQVAFPRENELVLLLLGIGILIFMSANRARLAGLPSRGLFMTAFHVLVLAWVFTVMEGLFWERLLNTAEHACYGLSSFLIAVWCWRAFVRREGAAA